MYIRQMPHGPGRRFRKKPTQGKENSLQSPWMQSWLFQTSLKLELLQIAGEVCQADLTRGEGIHNKLNRVGEALGKALGLGLVGKLTPEGSAALSKTQARYMKVRASQLESYGKEEFRAMFATC